MTLLDANLVIFAHQPSSPFHSRARLWFEDLLSSTQAIGIPALTAYAFVRFMTNPKFQARPLNSRQAVETVARWLSVPGVQLIHPGPKHWQILESFAAHINIGRDHLTDAAIAAISLEYNGIVHTHDRDFARYPGVRWHDPLSQ